MRRLFALIGLILVIGISMVSCHQELHVSRPPEYKKPLLFTLDKPEMVTFYNQDNVKTVNTCNRGDTVTVFLPTTYTGSYIYKAIYKWTTNSSELVGYKHTQIAPCRVDSLPPKWTFVAPDSAGDYEFYFRASYYYSASTPNGVTSGGYPTSSGVHGYEDKSSVYGVLTIK